MREGGRERVLERGVEIVSEGKIVVYILNFTLSLC